MHPMLSNPKYRNPAGRVLGALSAIRNAGQEDSLESAWSKVFCIDSKDDNLRFKIYEYLRDLDQECDLICEYMRDTKGDRADVFLRSIPKVRELLKPSCLAGNAKKNIETLTPELLHAIEVCAVEMAEEKPISEDELTTITNTLCRLFTMVRESKLKPALKKWVLQCLHEAQKGIDLYHIRGARAFQDALKHFYGEIKIYEQAFAEVAEVEPTIKNWMLDILTNLRDFSTRVKEWQPLIEYSAAMIMSSIPPDLLRLK